MLGSVTSVGDHLASKKIYGRSTCVSKSQRPFLAAFVYTQARTHTHAHTYAPTCTHAHAHTHTHPRAHNLVYSRSLIAVSEHVGLLP